MRGFLQRISSRKWLTALAVQIAAVVAIFAPIAESEASAAAIKIAGLAVMLLAAFGYGKIEAGIDGAKEPDER